MADIWQDQLFECSYGGVRIDVQSTGDAGGRMLATHARPHAEAHPVRDQGAEPRVTRARVIFFQTDDQDDPTQRFYFFKAAADQAKALTFVHPITGSYRARVGQLEWSAAAETRATITVECTFHEDADEPAVFELGAGTATRVGIEEASAAAAEVDSALIDFDDGLVDPDLTDDAVEMVRGWSDGEPRPGQEIDADLAEMSSRLTDETDALELSDDIAAYDVIVALAKLHSILRLAAESIAQDSPRLFEIRVESPQPLLVLAARVYGADEAEDRFEQLVRLNTIPNPARLEAGTRLRAQTPGSSANRRSAA